MESPCDIAVATDFSNKAILLMDSFTVFSLSFGSFSMRNINTLRKSASEL